MMVLVLKEPLTQRKWIKRFLKREILNIGKAIWMLIRLFQWLFIDAEKRISESSK